MTIAVGEVTLAIRVALPCPAVPLASDTVVVVVAWLTLWLITLEELAPKVFATPE